MSDRNRGGMREGLRQGLGVLSAFKEAVEETINDARERGDLSQDRAKEVMREALERAQEATAGARERLDLVPRRDMDGLRAEVQAMKARIARLEAHLGLDVLLATGDGPEVYDAPADSGPEGSPEAEEGSPGP